ncbi:hypothetical protein FOZ63_032110 [Perkinsus olseni]|uniref:Uncharacterized protein n=1 Tax=Perkinsus olseni TaxID=32597 RepID=A0A7J6U372_PEROL|nr:hypothetical protein FOZ63_032110 [Perkinsus olseni]
MVVFSSRHWRNLTNTVMGVQAITSDPLEKERKELANYAGRVQALHQHIVRLLTLTDEVTKVRQDILKDIQLIDAPEEDEDTLVGRDRKGAQEPTDGYSRATATFVDRVAEQNKTARDARPQLEKTKMTAQELVKRTGALQEKLRSRDRAFDELNHYNQKVTDLKADLAKKSKPNPKEDDRLARNVDKHRMAQERFTALDREVRDDMKGLVGQKVGEIARVIAEYSRYIGVIAAGDGKDVDTYSREIPGLVEGEEAKKDAATTAEGKEAKKDTPISAEEEAKKDTPIPAEEGPKKDTPIPAEEGPNKDTPIPADVQVVGDGDSAYPQLPPVA